MTSMQGRLGGWRWRFRDYLSKVMRASQVVLVVKNPPANAGDIRDVGLIPGSGIRKIPWRRA